MERTVNKVAIALGMVRDKPKSQYWAAFLKDVMSFFLSKCCSDFTPKQSWVQYVLESRNKKLFEELFDILRSKTKAGTLRLVAFSLVGMGLLSEDQEYCEGVYNYPYLYRPGPKRVHSGVPKFEGRCFICDVPCLKCFVRKRNHFIGSCNPCTNVSNRERFMCREAVLCLMLCLKTKLIETVKGERIPVKNVITMIGKLAWDDKYRGDEWRILYERIYWVPFGWRRDENGTMVEAPGHHQMARYVRDLRDFQRKDWTDISHMLYRGGFTKYHLSNKSLEKIYGLK